MCAERSRRSGSKIGLLPVVLAGMAMMLGGILPAHAIDVKLSMEEAKKALEEGRLPMEKALELAKAYAREMKIDLSGHYLDRVWIGHQEGQPDRRWIVSWSPKPEKRQPGKGWIILKVKLDGTVTDEAGAVPWLDRRRLLPPGDSPPSEKN